MSNIIEVEYDLVERSELNRDEIDDLMEADLARKESHAPYSNFPVGAAITANDGQLYVGWKLENPENDGLHAAENALGQMPAKSRVTGIKRITMVGGPREGYYDDAVTPCNPCRQQLLEFVRPEDNPLIIMAGTRGKVLRVYLKNELPQGFYPACASKR